MLIGPKATKEEHDKNSGIDQNNQTNYIAQTYSLSLSTGAYPD